MILLKPELCSLVFAVTRLTNDRDPMKRELFSLVFAVTRLINDHDPLKSELSLRRNETD